MFSRRPTAKILAGQKNSTPQISFFVQHKVGVEGPAAAVLTRFSLVKIAPFVEKIVAKPLLFDRFQELFVNECIGIDIAPVDWDHDAAVVDKLFHFIRLLKLIRINKASCDSCCRRHRGRDQMRATAISLPTFEVAV